MKSALEIFRRNTSEMTVQKEQVKLAFYNVIDKMIEKFVGTSVCYTYVSFFDMTRDVPYLNKVLGLEFLESVIGDFNEEQEKSGNFHWNSWAFIEDKDKTCMIKIYLSLVDEGHLKKAGRNPSSSSEIPKITI